jgi:hypothetical protein
LLLTVDRVFGTHLIEWQLARRQQKIDRLMADIDVVDRQLDALAEGLELGRMVLCVIALKQRSERDDLEDWLRFAPESDGEEGLLDNAVESLVKVRLASIDAERTGSGQYVYRLHPDWSGILGRLRDETVASDLTAWLEKQQLSLETGGTG